MKKGFTKKSIYIIIAVFTLITAVSVALIGQVGINYNISDYLSDDTETKISLDIIKNEFTVTSDIQVMVRDIDIQSANEIKKTISDIDNVLTVNFNANDENCYKDSTALFTVMVGSDEYSDISGKVADDIKTKLEEDYKGRTSYGGAVVNQHSMRDSIQHEVVFILIIGVCLVAVIMLITSRSWIEPAILLFASGIAVLLNLGTNFIFGEISYITNSVAAILQLALSIDYSIVLLHAYRMAKTEEADNGVAMLTAVKSVLKPVSASSLTTIAGLFALLFMSLTIGFDIGIVLIKAIICSAVTAMTLLPALLLLLDKAIHKTEKRDLVIRGTKFCEFVFKTGKPVLAISLAVIIACGCLQVFNTYSFTDNTTANTEIPKVFGKNSAILVVYPTSEKDAEKEEKLLSRLKDLKNPEGNDVLKSYTSYSTTVKADYTPEAASQMLGIPQEDINMLFTMYHLYGDPGLIKLTTSDFLTYTLSLIKSDKDAQLFIDKEKTELPEFKAFISYMMSDDEISTDNTEYSYTDMTARINSFKNAVPAGEGIDDISNDIISGIYIKYAESAEKGLHDPIRADEIISFVTKNLFSNKLLTEKLASADTDMLSDAMELIENAKALFVGENYSRMIITVDLPTDSVQTGEFVEYLTSATKDIFGENGHLAGEIISTYDLRVTFDSDNTLITVFTIVSIFFIILIIFKSLSLPLILVTIIQGAIWISMSISLLNGPVFFMSYIVTTCILMGATIDYGILMSTNYVQYRKTMDRKEALYKSVEAAMPTVFTSGMILTVCGFVVGAIASQSSISEVGFLLGKGTLVSTFMITVVLPAVLYLLDKFILKFSIKK